MFDGKLETFIKVAECGSFTKAAEDLYITPTAVMKQINALEKVTVFYLFSTIDSKSLKVFNSKSER